MDTKLYNILLNYLMFQKELNILTQSKLAITYPTKDFSQIKKRVKADLSLHNLQKALQNNEYGLSLCIQGTQVLWLYAQLGGRFIPVYTGNTGGTYATLDAMAVYPCVYREHRFTGLSSQVECGLSLCIQGTRLDLDIIQSLLPVYPCVYREHIYGRKSLNSSGGLSLCIQGTRMKRKITKKRRPVYPCVYREHIYPYCRHNLYFGLSLCIQGTL